MSHFSEISIVLGYSAGAVNILGFLLYNRKVFLGATKPNTATWALWAFIVGLNALTYSAMSGDYVTAFLAIAGGVACLLTFLFALVSGKFEPLNQWEKHVAILGCFSVLVWLVLSNAGYANLVLQLALLISFLPIFRSTWKNPEREHWLPWVVWLIAYVLSLITVFLRWDGNWFNLLYPVNSILFHGVVLLFSVRKRIGIA